MHNIQLTLLSLTMESLNYHTLLRNFPSLFTLHNFLSRVVLLRLLELKACLKILACIIFGKRALQVLI